MPITKNTIIELKDVSFQYDASPELALQSVSLQIHEGEFVAIVGPNGGGKTTLLRLILGLLAPDTGFVALHGVPPMHHANKAKIGYVPQRILTEEYQFPVTVEEVIQSGLIGKKGLFSLFNTTDGKAVKRALAITKLEKQRKMLISELSGGQRQRVFIARALVSQPEILILDEPTVGIDAASQDAFYQFLSEIHKKLNLTILFVSHDLELVTKAADHVLCVNKKLICHTHTHEFDTKNYVEQVYGKTITPLHHNHT